jgi:hypothetical protein
MMPTAGYAEQGVVQPAVDSFREVQYGSKLSWHERWDRA